MVPDILVAAWRELNGIDFRIMIDSRPDGALLGNTVSIYSEMALKRM
jgi:hypothetical protein